MKQLAIFDDYTQAKTVCDLLNTHGVPAGLFVEVPVTGEMELVYSGRLMKSPASKNPFSDDCKYSVNIAVEAQYKDAVDLMTNANHKILHQLNDSDTKEANNKIDSYPDSRILPFLFYFGAAIYLLVLACLPLIYVYADVAHSLFALGCAFSIGVMLQSFIMLSRATNLRNTFTILGFIALASFVLALLFAARFSRYGEEPGWIIYYIYFSYIAAYMLLFSILNKKRILPEVNTRSLILYNLIFLYYFIPYYLPSLAAWSDLTLVSRLILVLPILPSIVVLINGIISLPQFKYSNVFFYVWYLAMTAGLMVFMIYPQALEILSEHATINQKWVAMISLGMVALCVCANIINILILIPVTMRGQSSAERMAQVRDQLKFLGGNYVDDAGRLDTIILIAVVALVFVVNHLFIHANEIILVNIIFLMDGFLRVSRTSRRVI